MKLSRLLGDKKKEMNFLLLLLLFFLKKIGKFGESEENFNDHRFEFNFSLRYKIEMKLIKMVEN